MQVQALDQLPAHVDLVLASSGYEARARHVPLETRGLNARHRIALGFTERLVLDREKNDKILKEIGFEPKSANGDSGTEVKQVLRQTIQSARHNVSIVIDYTSMTRVWYASALQFLKMMEGGPSSIDVYFTYAPSDYVDPEPPKPNAHMNPIAGFSHLELPERKTALIIGLGYEQERALGLADYLEAAQTYAFYTDPALDDKFVETVLQNNAPLIRRLGEDRLIKYPLADMQSTDAYLTSLCVGLRKSHRVVVAPLGPKPFVLLSLLVATKLPSIDVWRVSPGEHGTPYNRLPLGQVLIWKVTFVSTENEKPKFGTE
jgi:hypothetical protein